MNKKQRIKTIIGDQFMIGFISLFAAIAVSLILAFPIKWVWNWIMPIFELPMISVLQAWGITLLVRLIFPSITSKPNNNHEKSE
ncbi:MAG: hypothetical protein WC123_03555 [Bacilli bacterium]